MSEGREIFPNTMDLGHVRKKVGYADNSQESAVGGTGTPGRDQDLRRLARS